jgi:hypothetical protein
LAEKYTNAMLAKNFRSRARKFLSEKSCVVRDDQGRLGVAAPNVLGDRRRGESDVCERKVFRDDRAPT